MKNGPKLSIPKQIQDMKDRGILFSIVNEADAARFLENNNYYFKLKAYAKNYDTYQVGINQGKYINLEFAYLKDLSTIDSELRKIILLMSIDLEHFLKVKLLSDFNKVDEDGYEIVQELFKTHTDYKKKIEEKSNTSTCADLVQKHRDDWAIWNIIEIMSFGQFVELYKLFYCRNSFENSFPELLLPVRMIRNAAAHNNCLINKMRPPFSREIKPTYSLRKFVSSAIKNGSNINNKLKLPTVHDFIALLYMYNTFVPEPTRTKGMNELKDLFIVRMPRNAEFYKKNQVITSNYQFVKSVIEYTSENFAVDKVTV